MSKDFEPCCGSPASCSSLGPCVTRSSYRVTSTKKAMELRKSVDSQSVQSAINECTHGVKAEADPNGLAANKPGAKLDAGKVRPGLVLSGFARALWAVAEIGTFGANKYTDNGWMEVPNGINRYNDAKWRHILKDAMGGQEDPESNKRHAAHEAWNALARLDLILREEEKKVEHL